MDSSRALNVEEVSKKLRIAKNTVYELIKRGDLKSYKVGRKVRIDQSDLEAYIHKSKNIDSSSIKNITKASTTVQSDKIIINGQDGTLDVLANLLERSNLGYGALRSYDCSFSGLASLYYDKCQVTAVHLWDQVSNSYNINYVKYMIPGIPCVIIHLSKRVQGFYVKEGNPKNIKNWHSLERSDVRFINREKGSGCRVLLDQKLKSINILPSEINGYCTEVTTHQAVANSVASEEADVGLGSESVANTIGGINFIPMQIESYDLVIKRENFTSPVYQYLYNLICSKEFKNSVSNFKGYDFKDSGKIIFET